MPSSRKIMRLWRLRSKIYDLWVADRYRVLFVIDHDVVVSFSIGPHSIVSK
jgi:hypothetical protein